MEPKNYFVHESSYVDEPCEIGPGTKIWHFSHVMKNSRIGAGCNIGQNVVISPDVTIGSNVKIQNNVSVYTGCILEDDVFCGPSMVFTNVMNPRSHVNRKDEYQTTLVRKGASLGRQQHGGLRDDDRPVRFCRGRFGGDARRAGLRTGLRKSRASAWLDVRLRHRHGIWRRRPEHVRGVRSEIHEVRRTGYACRRIEEKNT